jgi:hypothetical protein
LASREFYLNSDFDLSLGGRPSLLETPDPTFVHEMAWHFLFAAGEGDSLILHRDLPEEFLAYLSAKGMKPPRTVLHPEFTSGSVFTPFGWNTHAETLASRYPDQPAHPDLGVVKIANSRVFNLALEREWADDAAGYGNLFDSLDALEGFLRARTETVGWVVKGDHGHAGTANRRVPSGALSGEDRRNLALLFEQHGRVVAEPWDERLMDMAVNFSVEKGGAFSRFRGHQLLNSRDGAFLGVKILPSKQPPDPWRTVLEASAERLAVALDALGYAGPVSVDAYVRNTPEGPRLRPLVDINARLSMAMPAHGLADRLPGKTLLWMWTKPRKLDIPETYRELDRRLGDHAFRSGTGTGILAVSPIALGPPDGGGSRKPKPPVRLPGAARPKRIGFLFSADDEDALTRLQAGFTQALGRT